MTFPKIIQFDIRLSLRVFTGETMTEARNEAIKQLMEKLQMSKSQAILVIEEGGLGSLNQTGLWKGKYNDR